MSNRVDKSYSGELMRKGTENENIILRWLERSAKDIIDFRDFRLAQRIDVDFGIETLDGNIILAEIKSDKWIKESGNLLFECNRINHFVLEKWFYLGWGWRSPAQKLIVRNPGSGETFVFDFPLLRKFIARYVAKHGKDLEHMDFIRVVETDKQKTTFNYLIPMVELKGLYKKYLVKGERYCA